MNVLNSQIKVNNVTLRRTNTTGKNFKVNPIYEKKITKLSDNEYEIVLYVSIYNTDENPFPVEFETEFSTTFKFENVTEQEILKYLNISAIQMIFPFIRSLITNVFASSLMQPLVLPIIDVRVFKEKE